jgi:signal transduction histidine kinase/CHASE3 domain sensor protein
VTTALSVGACCAVTLVLLTSSIDALHRATTTAAETSEAIVIANRIETAGFAVESAERGFVATGSPVFIERFDALAGAHDRDLAALADRLRAYEQYRFRRLDAAMNRLVWGWAMPQVALARVDLPAARRWEASGGGIRLLAAVKQQMSLVRTYERRLEQSQAHAADVASHRTTEVAIIGFAAVMLIAFAYVFFLRFLVVRPIHRLRRSMREIGDGVRRHVRANGIAEVGDLERGFNDMATAIDEQRSRAETARLELERAVVQTASEKARVDRLFSLAERLAAETELSAAGRVIVDCVAAAVTADGVALSTIEADGNTGLRLLAGHGSDRTTAPVPPAGRRASGEVLELPLVHGGTVLGSIAITRAESGFTEDERVLLRHMAEQSSVALNTIVAHARSVSLGMLNETLIESSRDGIRLIDLDGAILAQNSRMTEMIRGGVTLPAEGTFWEQAAAVSPRTTDPAAFDAVTEGLRANPEAELQFEYEIAATGQVLSRLVAPVLDAAGTQIGRIVTLRDVTIERQAQRSKDDFVASVTHELRTPLTSIAGYLELLLENETGELSGEQRHFLEVVDRNATRLLRLVNDLLFVGRLESGMLELQSAGTDLAGVLADAVEAATPAAELQQIALHQHVDSLPMILADRSRLAQLVDNLLSNAIKFTPAGGTVTVCATADESTVTLLVSDTGVGVPAAEKDRLFERFFRSSVATAQAVPGTGLGLSIAKAIVEAHGGTIGVEDTPGGGTTFRVEFPLVPMRAAVAA